MQDLQEVEVGSKRDVSQFQPGDMVSLRGISKGKGFQGVVKRHGFSGSMASHGRKHDLRKGGSIGCAFPEHVIKGRKMAGRMGFDQVTLHNISVVSVDTTKNLMAVKGSVPGAKGTRIRCFFYNEGN
jgi:large subunit ribosomal protein L3